MLPWLYKFPSLAVAPAEASGMSWPTYDARRPRSRKNGTFGSQGQAAAIQARTRLQKQKQGHHNAAEEANVEKELRVSVSREAADALAVGNATRAWQLQRRAQVAASLVAAATESQSNSPSVSVAASPNASCVSLSGDSGYEETLDMSKSRKEPASAVYSLKIHGPGTDIPATPASLYTCIDVDYADRRHAWARVSASASYDRRSRPSSRQSLRPTRGIGRTSTFEHPRSRLSCLSWTSTSGSSVVPLTRRLAPLPRFDPFMRTRSESLSSIIHAPDSLATHTSRTGLALPPRSVRKCKTTGNIKGRYRLGATSLR